MLEKEQGSEKKETKEMQFEKKGKGKVNRWTDNHLLHSLVFIVLFIIFLLIIEYLIYKRPRER